MNENFDENKINPDVEADLEAESEVIDETESKEVYEAAEAEELAKAKAEKGRENNDKKEFSPAHMHNGYRYCHRLRSYGTDYKRRFLRKENL